MLIDMLVPNPTEEQRGEPRRLPATHRSAAGLAGSLMAERFCFWSGRSGRRYVFSVYRIDEGLDAERHLPRYVDAVVIAARRERDGVRRAVKILETGCLPDIMPGAVCSAGNAEVPDELHFHLLAGSKAERAAVLKDLAGLGTDTYRH